MLDVVFVRGRKNRKNVGSVETEEEAYALINSFLKDSKYVSFYKRVWKTNEKTTRVDFGSHTEFFDIVAT